MTESYFIAWLSCSFLSLCVRMDTWRFHLLALVTHAAVAITCRFWGSKVLNRESCSGHTTNQFYMLRHHPSKLSAGPHEGHAFKGSLTSVQFWALCGLPSVGRVLPVRCEWQR